MGTTVDNTSVISRILLSPWLFLVAIAFFVLALGGNGFFSTFGDDKRDSLIVKSKIVMPPTNSYDRFTRINTLTRELLVSQQKGRPEGLVESVIKNTKIKDQSYIERLSQMNKKDSTADLKNKPLAKVDYYNRVSIDASKKSSANDLQNRINNMVLNIKEDKYVKDLGKESIVRLNEVRSIKLKKGESIWKLAKRAYGDGMLYHKIMEANPHITEENARTLSPGTLIRVPM